MSSVPTTLLSEIPLARLRESSTSGSFAKPVARHAFVVYRRDTRLLLTIQLPAVDGDRAIATARQLYPKGHIEPLDRPQVVPPMLRKQA